MFNSFNSMIYPRVPADVQKSFSSCKGLLEAKNGPQCPSLAKQCYQSHIQNIPQKEIGNASSSCPKVNKFVECLGVSCYNGQDAAPYTLYVAEELSAVCEDLLEDASCPFFTRIADFGSHRGLVTGKMQVWCTWLLKHHA